jgi:NADH:ubiquinone oxidoreductase subunit 6 (subunit J)
VADIPAAAPGAPDPPNPDPAAAARVVQPRAKIPRAALVVGITIIAVLAILFTIYVATRSPPETADNEQPTMMRTAGGFREWRQAAADHEAIAVAVAACSRIYDLWSQPKYIRDQLRLDSLPNARRNQQKPDEASKSVIAPATEPAAKQKDSTAAKPKPPTELIMSNYMRAAIYLSDSITRARVEAATNARINYTWMFWFQILIVCVGAVTTVLISVKSMLPTGNDAPRRSFWIGFAAIVASSIGTGIAASNSFLAPREAYLKNERSLGALRQLHSDIASHIAGATDSTDPRNCPKLNPTGKDDPLAKQIQDWSAKLGVIMNAADSGSSSSSSDSAANQTN